ncbi:zinc finger, CCHC-type containing protein [Tanacetum coccineum]
MEEVSDQHSYCFNVEDDHKTFNEAMKSQDVAFWKEEINDEMDSIIGNNTWVLADLPPAFLNGDLDEEVYKNQPQGFIMHGNENKVCELIKSLYVLTFSMKNMGDADVILGLRIKHESNGITISRSHYIEKVLKKFNYFDCTPVSTPIDTSEKLMPNNGQTISQLEYSRVIGCLMYAMNCTRPNIAFAVDMSEDSKIPIILERAFLATVRAMIDVFNKRITLKVGDDEVIFDMEQLMKNPPTEDDECYNKFTQDSDIDIAIRRIDSVDTAYSKEQKIKGADTIKNEHLYPASTNEIDEKKPELKHLPTHLEYAYLHGNECFPIIISSKLLVREIKSLLQVLEKHKRAIA